MVSIRERFAGFFAGIGNATPQVPVIDFDSLPNASVSPRSGAFRFFDGEKFAGGFGETRIFQMDYWTLRARSSQLFRENLYARGLIRRLITNEINTGLSLVSSPNPELIPLDDEQTTAWAESVENRYAVWAATPALCDYQGMASFGKIQRTIKREAYIDGDVLVVLRSDASTGLPKVQVVRGEFVRTPIGYSPTSSTVIAHGVEIDGTGRHVAYHVTQADGSSVRVPAFGERSNRRLAWLVYGSDRRYGEVRGEPLLAIIVQSLKELDRYRDATQRKAVINSLIAMFIKKGEDKPGTRPLTGGAARRDAVTIADGNGTQRQLSVSTMHPGIVLDELQHGEEPVAFRPDGGDINYSVFESAIVHAMAWANEVPPEILELSFASNYSASQAAVNEFRIYLNRVRTEFGEDFCAPVYHEWLLAELLSRKVNAPGLLEAMRDPRQFDVVAAWFASEWPGAIKPSTDIVKQTRGYEAMTSKGWVTNEQASRELTGTKFRTNIRRLTRENQLLVEALRPLLEMQQQLAAANSQGAPADASIVNALHVVEERIDDLTEGAGG